MIKVFFLLFIVFFSTQASIKEIENKINANQKAFEKITSKKSSLNNNIRLLAQKINDEEQEYKNIIGILDSTNTQLVLNSMKLSSAKTKIESLQEESKKLLQEKEKIEQTTIDYVIEKYAMSMGIEQADKESLNDVIGKEVYNLIFDNARQEILNINIDYLKINNQIRENEKRIEELTEYLTEQNTIKERYKNLEIAYEKKLETLREQHAKYQENLQAIIDKQNEVTNLLGSLNILKQEEIKKEEERIQKIKEAQRKKEEERKKQEAAAKLAKTKKQTQDKSSETIDTPAKQIKFDKREDLDKDIDVEVRKIGSSAKGIKIAKYNGAKTIAPLKSYEVVKKFGKYYDDVYKMELFNESVSLKTKIPNAKVFNVFDGQVVYAKENSGLLSNVVIVKHKDDLHTIYSHLDQIAPTLKVGKYIQKGYVVGRINDTLEFQATKNSRYIDPIGLIK